MVETIGENPKRQCLRLGLRLDGRVSVDEHAWQLGHDPPIIGLALKLHAEVQSSRVPQEFCNA